tara:strand:+ start:757 stop:3006 length:2250 start_codon:yes stop_codon:yes gene_type:complete
MKKVLLILILCNWNLVFSQNFPSESNLLFLNDQLYRININISQSSLNSLLSNSTPSDILYDSSIEFISSNQVFYLNNVGIRLRGNTSLTAPKKSFKLDFNSFVPGRKFLGVEKLNLNANHNDPSLFRAAISWNILREMNLPNTRTSFAELFINDDFMGVYVVTEHIDDEFIKNNYEKDYGNLYKCLWPAPLHFIEDSPEAYKFESNGRRAYDLKTNKFADDYSDLAQFISVLNNTPDDDFVCEIESVFNVADYLKILALDVLIGNWDGYAGNKNNFYLYHNPLTDLFDYIPYDLDNTWGITWGNFNWESENPYNWANNMSFGNEFRPLYDRILAVQEYRNLFSHYLTHIINNWFNHEFVTNYISSRLPLLSESILIDEYYPLSYGFTSADYENSLSQAWGEHVRFGFIDWVDARVESLNLQIEDQMPVLVLHEISDNSPVLDTLKIRAQVYASENVMVSALVNTDNDFQIMSMFDDGLHSDLHENDGVWGIEIPILPGTVSLDYRVQVSTDNSPRTAPCEPVYATVGLSPNDIKINELMALNSNVIADEFFEFDDWCELYNSDSSSVELIDFYLTDNISRPNKYKIPQQAIQGGEFTFYWLDKDQEQGENHASFKLSSKGEELALFEKNGNYWFLRDYISFGLIQEDVSYGRVDDGSSQWQLFEIPTPNYSNNLIDIIEYSNSLLTLWPNPSSSGLIYFSENRSGYICDLIGNKILEFINTDFVDISSSPSGIFLLKTLQGEVFSVIRH